MQCESSPSVQIANNYSTATELMQKVNVNFCDTESNYVRPKAVGLQICSRQQNMAKEI